MENKLDIRGKLKVEYTELFNKDKWNEWNLMYFVLTKNTVIPFKIIKIINDEYNFEYKNKNYGIHTMEAYIYWRNNKIYVKDIEFYFINSKNNEFNISLEMIIHYDEFNKHYVENIDDLCYIVE